MSTLRPTLMVAPSSLVDFPMILHHKLPRTDLTLIERERLLSPSLWVSLGSVLPSSNVVYLAWFSLYYPNWHSHMFPDPQPVKRLLGEPCSGVTGVLDAATSTYRSPLPLGIPLVVSDVQRIYRGEGKKMIVSFSDS